MVSDDVWHLLGCSGQSHGWHDVDGHIQVADENAEFDDDDAILWDDNCLLIYANTPDPWHQLSTQSVIYFCYYGLHYTVDTATFSLRKYTSGQLPILDFNNPITLSKEIQFLKDYEEFDLLEHPTEIQEWKERLYRYVKELSQCYISGKKYLGV